jgi:hypothetical protein
VVPDKPVIRENGQVRGGFMPAVGKFQPFAAPVHEYEVHQLSPPQEEKIRGIKIRGAARYAAGLRKRLKKDVIRVPHFPNNFRFCFAGSWGVSSRQVTYNVDNMVRTGRKT